MRHGPAGAGLPVMLIPGFLSADWSMATMAKFLKAWNFAPARSGIRLNVDCTAVVLDRLESRLTVVAQRSGRSVAIVGWSRGGTLGKLLAIRRPDLVAGLVTLASPNNDPLAVSKSVIRQVNLLVKMNKAGLRNVLSADCVYGECADEISEALASPFPTSVAYTSIYTRLDGIVDWRACLDPAARLIEVNSTHLGIGTDPSVLRLVGKQLAEINVPATTIPVARSG